MFSEKLERVNSIGGRSGINASLLGIVPTLRPSQIAIIHRSWKHINVKVNQKINRPDWTVYLRGWTTRFSGASKKSFFAIFTYFTYVAYKSFQLESVSECSKASFNGQQAQSSTKTSNFCSVSDHTRYFLNLLDRIIDKNKVISDNILLIHRLIDLLQDVDLELKLIGAAHASLNRQYGFGVAEIEKLGEIFAEAFLKMDSIRQSKEATWVLMHLYT